MGQAVEEEKEIKRRTLNNRYHDPATTGIHPRAGTAPPLRQGCRTVRRDAAHSERPHPEAGRGAGHPPLRPHPPVGGAYACRTAHPGAGPARTGRSRPPQGHRGRREADADGHLQPRHPANHRPLSAAPLLPPAREAASAARHPRHGDENGRHLPGAGRGRD